MLNDIGNQKLPRFRAGLPLLEQVTAQRLNDICAMIEASRLQNGVGYTMNRSAGGTTLTILDTLITKNSKAWRISFGDEFSEMEKSMLAVYIAKDTEELPDIKFPDSATIRSAIENAFKTFRKTPKSGDVIWNETDGLRYLVFSEKILNDCGGAVEKDFYSIKFSIGEKENAKTFYALYVGEHPQQPAGRTPSQPIAGPAGRDGENGKDSEKGEKGDKGKINIILLSGGSGMRLWPLSNGIRSKQFLKVLKSPDGGTESMAQRIVRQLEEAGMASDIVVATSRGQRDTVVDQIGNKISDVVTEPSRRDTFPAIALAASFLQNGKGLEDSDVAVAMPIDAYTDGGYFSAMLKMAEIAREGIADITLMGITPTQASSKFGYIVPARATGEGEFFRVSRFVEKPDAAAAARLISEGTLWNGGVFAFRLGHLRKILSKYIDTDSFDGMRSQYESLPKTSFDYEVVEKAESVAVVPFSGIWKDLGTWDSITEEMPSKIYGNALADSAAKNTHIVNELEIPVVCLGVRNAVIAASPDGILAGTKDSSEKLKGYAESVRLRPMFEERRWGEYKVIAYNTYPDGRKSLTKVLRINDGSSISYQKHTLRDEIWTCVNGLGTLVVDGKKTEFKQGDVAKIGAGQMHGIMGLENLQIVEVQLGWELSEDDIIRSDFIW